jgi:hypothetical protein
MKVTGYVKEAAHHGRTKKADNRWRQDDLSADC